MVLLIFFNECFVYGWANVCVCVFICAWKHAYYVYYDMHWMRYTWMNYNRIQRCLYSLSKSINLNQPTSKATRTSLKYIVIISSYRLFSTLFHTFKIDYIRSQVFYVLTIYIYRLSIGQVHTNICVYVVILIESAYDFRLIFISNKLCSKNRLCLSHNQTEYSHHITHCVIPNSFVWCVFVCQTDNIFWESMLFRC